MHRFLQAAAALLVAALLLIAHRAAYKGYFSDDDLDNLVNTRQVSARVFAGEFITPVFSAGNFRPAGHLYYRLLGDAEGLNFPPYVVVLHLLHGLNIVLVWLLLRRMGAPPAGAWAGALLFAFHMAVFDALWKPMYIFDLLCGTFTLLTLLLYLRGWWVAALLPFWLGYKSKELIVVLPLLLLAWEFLAGERKWKRVLPFLAIAASFSLQGVLHNSGTDNDYTLRFTPEALRKTLRFYGSAMLLIPYLGLALPLLALIKDSRVRWGLLFLFLMPAPLWFLPARLFSVYLYVPLIGLAVVFAFLASRCHVACIALFFLIWMPSNYRLLKKKRTATLAAAVESSAYVAAVGGFLSSKSPFDAVIHDGGPEMLNSWGKVASVRWFDARPELVVCSSWPPDAKPCLEKQRVVSLGWNRQSRRLIVSTRTPGLSRVSSVDMSGETPLDLFDASWYSLESGYRWTSAASTLKMSRPSAARAFSVRVNVSPMQLNEQGDIALEVLLDGRSLGVRTYTTPGWSEQRWPLQPAPAGDVTVTLKAVKPFRPTNGDPRVLGVAVGALGFAE